MIISNIQYVRVTKDKEMIESYKVRLKVRLKMGKVGKINDN